MNDIKQNSDIGNMIRYVEPNILKTYKSPNGETFERAQDLEDYCIAVDLEVEINGRHVGGRNASDNVKYVISWDTKNGSASLMQGSRLKCSNGDKINVFTSKDAEFTFKDLESNSDEFTTSEMFGISSIDINYDNFYVPQVTINFVDIRGISLFMPEELRHNMSIDGIDGLQNNDVAGSFFKSFFTFPYPLFKLMVKGFYGKPVTYELSLVDWKASFNSDSGNFGCVANFVGYSYALLSDLTLNSIIAAPQSDYVGKDYWEKREFKFQDGNLIPTFMELVKRVKKKEEKIIKYKSDSPLAIKYRQKNNELIIIDKMIDEFKDIIHIANTKVKPTLTKNTSVFSGYIDYPKNKGFIIASQKKGENDSLIKDLLLKKISNLNASIEDSNSKLGTYYNTFDFEEKENLREYIKNLDESDYKKIALKLLNTTEDTEGIYDYGYVFDGERFNNKLIEDKTKISQEIENISKELSEYSKAITIQTLGFMPNIENFMDILLAHVDCLVHCIYNAADVANESTDRTLESLGIVSSDCDPSLPIPAFPKVGVYGSNSTNNKIEDGWIGEYDESAPEANLTLGLLNGMKNTLDYIQKTIDEININKNDNYYASSPIYVCPMDLMLNGNMFQGTYFDFSNYADVMARIGTRGMTVCSSNSAYKDIAKLGKYDAHNFYNNFGNPTDDFKKWVKNNKDVINQGASPISLLNITNNRNSYILGEEPVFSKLDDNSIIFNSKIYKEYVPLNNYSSSNFLNDGSINFLPYYKIKDKGIKDSKRTYENNLGFIIKIMSESEALSYNNIMERNRFAKNDEGYKDILSELKINITPTSKSKEDIENAGTLNRSHEYIGNYSSYFGNYPSYDGIIKEIEPFFFLTILIDDKNFIESIYNKYNEIYTFVNTNSSSDGKSNISMQIDKITILRIGCFLKNLETLYGKEHQSYKKIKKILEDDGSIAQLFINYFNKWFNSYNSQFTKIYNEIMLNDDTVDALKKTTNKQEVIDIINSIQINGKQKYKIINEDSISYGENFFVSLALSEPNNDIIKLYKENVYIYKFMNLKTDNETPPSLHNRMYPRFIPNNNMKLYLQGLFTELDKIYEQLDVKEAKSMVEDPDASKHIQISLYNYLKTIYDRWLCGKNNSDRGQWYFDEFRQRFIFIDSFYFKIGETFPIDMEKVVSMMEGSLKQNTVKINSFIYDLLGKHDMMFMSIQNFSDLSKPELFDKVFTPIPYREIGRIKPQSDFVCMYTYRKSNHLNVDGCEFLDDGFSLGDKSEKEKTKLPFLNNKNEHNGYTIPCFGVSYGKQYQSYFTNINTSTESPIATEQSLKAQFLLANLSKNGSAKEMFIGQDLYTVYSNNSYTCTVDMMGCAWVQPLMYFTLLNVPLFKGSYLIHKVSHHIQPGNMTTSFTGTRMSKFANPLITDPLYYSVNDESGEKPKRYNNVEESYHPLYNCDYVAYQVDKDILEESDYASDFADNFHAKGFDNALYLFKAIGKSCKNSSTISQDIVLNGYYFGKNELIMSISCKDVSKNYLMYDMIIRSYKNYCTSLAWICEDENQYMANVPSCVYIALNKNDVYNKAHFSTFIQHVGNGDNFTKNIPQFDSLESLSSNFVNILSKNYKNSETFYNECPNFRTNSNEKTIFLDLLRINAECRTAPISSHDGNIVNKENNSTPIKGNLPSQCHYPMSSQYPISGKFGEPRKNHLHQGIDIGTHGNSSIEALALFDGIIVRYNLSSNAGQDIIIKYNVENSNGETMYSRYLHCSSNKDNLFVGLYDPVKQGERVGIVSNENTKYNFPIHLHMEIAFFKGDYSFNKFQRNVVDPLKYYKFGSPNEKNMCGLV